MSEAHAQVQKVVIKDNNAGQRLDNFLVARLKGVPKAHIYNIIRTGQVRINSKRAKPTTRLATGDLLRIPPIRTKVTKEVIVRPDLAKYLQDNIIYQDEFLLALDKPAGLAVHSGSGTNAGVIEIMRSMYGDDLELVHRLDRATSGCLLIATKSKYVKEFHKLLREQEFTKLYKLCCIGRWPKHIKQVSVPISKVTTKSGDSFMQVREDGDEAITLFDVDQYCENNTLLTAQLITGRTHQIRLHAAHAGFPIIGDGKYGDYALNKELAKKDIKHLMLHAWKVEFTHPFTHERTQIAAPLSKHFSKQLELFG